MRTLLLILGLCTVFIVNLNAQRSISMGIYLGLNGSASNSWSDITEQQTTNYTFIENDMAERYEAVIRRTHDIKFIPETSSHLGLEFEMELSNNFSLSTGFEINFSRMSIEDNSTIDIVRGMLIDTVEFILNSNTGLPSSTCTTVVNTIDPNSFTRSEEYFAGYIEIPLRLRILNVLDDFSIELGSYINTPFVNKYARPGINLVPIEEGSHICEEVFDNNEVDTPQSFNQLGYGFNLGFEYSLSKRISISLRVKKQMNNLYTFNTGGFFEGPGVYKPTSIFFSCNYSLGTFVRIPSESEL